MYFGLDLQVNERLNNSIFSVGFQIKNLVILNGSTNVRFVIQMALELQFFLKHYKKSPSGGGPCPQALVCKTFKLN